MVAMDGSTSQLAALIAGADEILVVTGAGVSTDSGIPDYRGPKGIWNTERPVMFQDFLNDPEQRALYWDQKLRAADFFDAAEPGAAHHACVDVEAAGKLTAIALDKTGTLTRGEPVVQDVIEFHGIAPAELLRRAATNQNVDTALILKMGLLKLPFMGQKMFPFAVLFGAMFTFLRLTRTNQLVVSRGVGVSAWQFLAPALVLAVVIVSVRAAVKSGRNARAASVHTLIS